MTGRGALRVDRGRAWNALSDGVLSTDEVMQRVEAGTPFRTAYREVAAEVAGGSRFALPSSAEVLRRRRSTGSPGALGLGTLRARLRERSLWARGERRRFSAALRRLTRP